jgi:indolepyruvate ferredoxin oxidoreductase, beta subunit
MNYDIFLVGVGGQGILTIGEILAEAALLRHLPVNFFPSKGMAQRGGFVKAQLRIGQVVVGPNIPECGADLVIAMELSEALKAVRFARPGGDFLLYADIWSPTAVMLGKAAYPSAQQVKAAVAASGARLSYVEPASLPADDDGSPLPDNVFLLGVAMGQTALSQLMDPADVLAAVRNRWPRGAERNLHAFRHGLTLSAAHQAAPVAQP